MTLDNPHASSQERLRAADALARLINDNVLIHFRDEDGYPVEIEAIEVKAFIKQHWEKIARYAHLIHGS